MAIHHNGVIVHNHKALKSADWRALNFFLYYLQSVSDNNSDIKNHPYPVQDQRQLKSILQRYMDFELQHRGVDYNDALINLAVQNLLPEDEFNWLKNSESACIFAWGYIKQKSSEIDDHFGSRRYNDDIKKLKLSEQAFSHHERVQTIQQAFDAFLINGRWQESKSSLMAKLREAWEKSAREKPISWLNQTDLKITNWALDYIETYNQKQSENSAFSIKPVPVDIFTLADSPKECFLAINAALKLWQAHPDTIKLFYQNITKAWKQRELRRTREHMKAINTYISVEAKDKLDKLAKLNRARMNEMLEVLIEDQYDKQREEIERKYGT